MVPLPGLMLAHRKSQYLPKTLEPTASSSYDADMATIVLIEDDMAIRAAVAGRLADHGHVVHSARTALKGLDLVVNQQADVVLLDLGLPDVDGRDLLKMLRAISDVPVVVITARGDDEDVVGTLDAGADDYLIKPFSTSQLAARIRAVLRRRSGEVTDPVLKVGGLEIDPAGRTAARDGDPLQLSPKEFDILAYLASRVGEVVSKRELLAEVWREPYGGGEKSVDVHLSWLRKKLGESAAEPNYLRTVFGVEVKLVEPAP